jgi:DNA transformation protein
MLRNAVRAIQKRHIRKERAQCPPFSRGMSRPTSCIITHRPGGGTPDQTPKTVMKGDSLKDFTLEQLAGRLEIRCRSMFGGHGLYLEDTFFAIIYQGQVYFKTDSRTRGAYLREGSKPFRPTATQTLRSYFEVPAAVLEDAETLTEWAREAAATAS